jgi:hypothetical protein
VDHNYNLGTTSQIFEVLALLLALLQLAEVELLEIFVFKAVAADDTIPSEAGFDVEAVCVALVGAFEGIALGGFGPSAHGVIPDVSYALLLRLLFFLILHAFLPLGQSAQDLLLFHLFLLLGVVLLDSTLFVSVYGSGLLRDDQI